MKEGIHVWKELASSSHSAVTACLLVGVTLAAAQTIAGQISGTVVDSSKGRLPGVTVAVINEGITRLQSGGYLTPQANTSIGGRRADYLGGEVAISDANEVKWFNTAAFGPAPEDRRGNAAVGNIQGPGRHTWDLSFRKKVRITGRAKVGVQADVFNLFDRVNLNNPSVNFNDTNYGRIASAGPPRQVQIGLRFEF